MALGSFLTPCPNLTQHPPVFALSPWGTLLLSQPGTHSWMLTNTKGCAEAVTGSSCELCAALEGAFPLGSGMSAGKMLQGCPHPSALAMVLRMALISPLFKAGQAGCRGLTAQAGSVWKQHTGSRQDTGVKPRSASAGEVEQGKGCAKSNSSLASSVFAVLQDVGHGADGLCPFLH